MLADVAFYTCTCARQQQQRQRQRVSTTLFFMRIACLDIYHQINMDEIDFFSSETKDTFNKSFVCFRGLVYSAQFHPSLFECNWT